MTPPSGFIIGNAWGRPVRDRATYADNTAIERFFTYEWRGKLAAKAEIPGTLSGGLVTGTVYSTSYSYYSGPGSLQQINYPSGQNASYGYDPGGVLARIRVNGNLVLSAMKYAAHGAVETETVNGTAGTCNWAQQFNLRNWPKNLKAGPGITLTTLPNASAVLFGLDYAGYETNGNITSVTRHRRPSSGGTLASMTNTYTYDTLNRLASYNFNTGSLTGQYTFAMDAWGNLTAQTKTGGSASGVPGTVALPVDVNASGVPLTNRLSGKTYDILGNMKDLSATQKLVYQDQGHVLKMTDAAGTTVLWRYYYDSDGKRRIKAAGTSGISTNCTYSFYEGEDLICQLDKGTQVQSPESYTSKHLLLDHLGTTRAELTFNASNQPVVNKFYDYMPYGEEIAPAPAITEQIKFTGKQRDTESGLDNFGARLYGSNLGRWLSTDLVFADNKAECPQSWNLFTYVGSNPICRMDPTGLRGTGIGVLYVDDFGQETFVEGANSASVVAAAGVNRKTVNTDKSRTSPQQQKTFLCPEHVLKFFSNYDVVYTIIWVAGLLQTDPLFVAAHASWESGWLEKHNAALNNLFGLTDAGRKNLRFNSMIESGWTYVRSAAVNGLNSRKVFGAKTIEEFADQLQAPNPYRYNSLDIEGYRAIIINQYKTVVKYLKILGVIQ